MDLETLQFLWYAVFIFSIFAYAALDGFDIGVGCLHLFSKTDNERRIFLNAIGPVWDGNSLWVIISSGTLLAGFPKAFSSLLSSLYLPMLILVCGYVIRGAAIEFRSKISSTSWRSCWDCVFSFASYLLSFGFGIVIAHLINGIPLNQEGDLVRENLVLFPPYAILAGLFTTLLFMLHGALYLSMKTEGELNERLHRWLENIYSIFLFFWSTITMLTLIYQPQMHGIFQDKPAYLGFVLLGLIGIVLMPKAISSKSYGYGFLCSFLIIASLVLTYSLGTFPNIIRSSILPDTNSITIYNASSSIITLNILLIIAAIGVPLFFLYCIYSYKVFRGKVTIDTMSY